MPGHWIGPPHPSGVRECREGDVPGTFTWWDQIVRTWQETDEQGNPIGDPVEIEQGWEDSGETCVPGG
jgi:hypothetical protein